MAAKRERIEGEVREIPTSSLGDDLIHPDIYNAELSPVERASYDLVKAQVVAEKGYEDGPLLHMLVTLMLAHNQLKPNIRDGAGEKRLGAIADKIMSLSKGLDDEKARRASGLSIPEFHAAYMRDAAKFVREHAGEFAFECKGCGAIVSTDGLPLWACQFVDEGGQDMTIKWSPEALRLYNDGQIPMHVVCYILRTSPKEIHYSSMVREEELRECDEPAEEKLLRALLERDEEEFDDGRHGE